MNKNESSDDDVDKTQFITLVEGLRPELHRYCSRLMGSIIEGEDVVQDTLTRALTADLTMNNFQMIRAWLFRVAHNRAMDLLRSRHIRDAETIEVADEIADEHADNPLEMMMKQEATKTAVSRFMELPVSQRSVVILKDVLGESLEQIASMLDLTIDSVKAHLSRGRIRLREINARLPLEGEEVKQTSEAVVHFVMLFNMRDWDGLRLLLADDVKLQQSAHPVRTGSADVGMFFTNYARVEGLWLVPAWFEDREIIVAFENRTDALPDYIMWLEWREGRITFIRDYRHVRYVVTDIKQELSASLNTQK